MQPLLDVLGAAGDPTEHPAGLARRRRSGGYSRRSGLCRRRLDGRWRNARGVLLVRVGRGHLHHGRNRSAIAEDDLLRTARERVRVAYVLVAGESWILAPVGINQMDRLHTGRSQLSDLGLVLVFLLRDQRLDGLITFERRARFAAGNLVLRGRVKNVMLSADQNGRFVL